MTAATPIYRALMVAIETRRQELGLPMWKVDDAAGTPDGYFPKALWPDTPSGRQANWDTVQTLIETLWPDGFTLTVKEKNGASMPASKQRVAVRFAGARFDAEKRADWMTELSKKGASKGGHARADKLSKRRRHRIARKAAKARWRKPRLVEITPRPAGG